MLYIFKNIALEIYFTILLGKHVMNVQIQVLYVYVCIRTRTSLELQTSGCFCGSLTKNGHYLWLVR